MFLSKSNSISKIFILIIFLSYSNISNLFSLTQDMKINIGSASSLKIEYVLAKGICKMLHRQYEISKFMGGKNILECNVKVTKGTEQNIELIKKKIINYAIIDIDKINSKITPLASIIFLKSKNTNWALITSAKQNKQEACEVTEAIFNNSLELKYLHSDFQDFSDKTFQTKKIPFHMGAFKYFENKKCKFNLNNIGEL